ncbi:MAG: pseudouridine synthase, partial [Bdellovibrionota bacterium]
PKLEGGLLQRLDRDTSGLLAVALNKEVKESLRQAFSQGKFRKTYLAIVSGNPSGKYTFDLRDAAGGKVQAFQNPNGSSTLEIKVRGEKSGFSLVEIATAQGSRHIVRACLAQLGSALVGDAAYGGNTEVAPFHQLHAFRIKLLENALFRDFPNGLEAPLPQSFLDCLGRLGLH